MTKTSASSDANRANQQIRGDQRRKVYGYILKQGRFGATDQEVEAGLKIPRSSASARRLELERDGWVRATKRSRRTDAGQKATVFVGLTEQDPAATARVCRDCGSTRSVEHRYAEGLLCGPCHTIRSLKLDRDTLRQQLAICRQEREQYRRAAEQAKRERRTQQGDLFGE